MNIGMSPSIKVACETGLLTVVGPARWFTAPAHLLRGTSRQRQGVERLSPGCRDLDISVQ
ncbi:hypothetical protein BaRGS_00033474, partial [Batillaria attramentaria]